jgi:hypothetical protein
LHRRRRNAKEPGPRCSAEALKGRQPALSAPRSHFPPPVNFSPSPIQAIYTESERATLRFAHESPEVKVCLRRSALEVVHELIPHCPAFPSPRKCTRRSSILQTATRPTISCTRITATGARNMGCESLSRNHILICVQVCTGHVLDACMVEMKGE